MASACVAANPVLRACPKVEEGALSSAHISVAPPSSLPTYCWTNDGEQSHSVLGMCAGAALMIAASSSSYRLRRRRLRQRAVAVIGLQASGPNNDAVAPDRGFRVLEWASALLGGQRTLVKTASWGWGEAWRVMVRELAPQSPEGDYLRPESPLRAARDGVLEPLAVRESGYVAYVGNTCPWCHRVQLALTLRRLPSTAVDGVQLLDQPERASRGGWAFDPLQGASDPVFNAADLREVYDLAAGEGGRYIGRCTAPLLVDRSAKRAISNDSEEIVRLIATARLSANEREVDLLPTELESEIEETNRWTYKLLSNAVYRAGFGTTQAAFERAVQDAQRGLDKAEKLLDGQRFLCGEKITMADVMLLPCAVRFDVVYAFLFLRGSCGLWRERPSLRRWLGELWSIPGVRDTVDVAACQESYYRTLFPLNPSRIVPRPAIDPGAGLGPEEPLPLHDTEHLFHWRGGRPA